MSLNIGIESCGKSFSVMAVANSKGQILATHRIPRRLNYHENASTELGTLIYNNVKKLLQQIDVSVRGFVDAGGRVCAGLTGITTTYDRKHGMSRVWRDSGLKNARHFATGGIEIALAGATRSLRGIAVSSHVGSVALARNEGRMIRVGGWGPILGDEGSGFWIGMEAIKTICRWRDGRNIKIGTKVDKYVYEQLAKNSVWNDLNSVHKSVSDINRSKENDTEWRNKFLWADVFVALAEKTSQNNEFRYVVSDLARAVMAAWEDDSSDTCASAIVEAAMSELLLQADMANRNVGLGDEPFPFVLAGCIFRHHQKFREAFDSKVKMLWPKANVLTPSSDSSMRPVIGALMMAFTSSALRYPNDNIVTNLFETSKRFPDLEND